MPTPNPLVIPTGYAQCTFIGEWSGNLRRVTFSIGAHLGIDEPSLAGHLATWFDKTTGDGWRVLCSTDFFNIGVEVLGNNAVANVTTSHYGNQAGIQLPPNNTPKFRKVTAHRGRAHKGYLFPYGCADRSEIDHDGTLSPTWITDLNTAFQGMLTAMATDGSAPVVLHHALSSDVTPTPVLQLALSPSIHSQRRRLEPRA